MCLGTRSRAGSHKSRRTPSPAPRPRSLCASCLSRSTTLLMALQFVLLIKVLPSVSVTDMTGRSLILLFSEGRAYLRGRVQSAFTRLAIEALSDTELTLQTNDTDETTPILNCFEC